ncbi:MAG: M23 family metallopeptidase [Bacillota bacterium]
MSWRSTYQDRSHERSQRAREVLGLKGLPIWAKQALAAVFIFFVLLGAAKAQQGLALDVVAAARDIVTTDLSWDGVKTWAAGIPSTLRNLADLDLKDFWSRAVSGKPKELAWPVMGDIISHYGWRPNPDSAGVSLHQGIDIAADRGTPVKAVLDGVVANVRQSSTYGLVVEIEHGGGLSTVYGHLDSVAMTEGEKVKQGDTIGKVGESGNATDPHLHFELRKDGLEIDPLTVLPPPDGGT